MTGPDRHPADPAITALGFGALFLLTYFASSAVPTPLLWYAPEQHLWSFEVRPQGLAMDIFGRLALALGCGVAGALAARLGLRLAPGALRGRGLTVLLWWNVSLFLFNSGLYFSLLSSRAPVAVPLPAGYVPR
jgi:hypothetical protein